MIVLSLTAPQIAALATLNTDQVTARSDHRMAMAAFDAHVSTILDAAGLPQNNARVRLSDDGNFLTIE